MKKILFFFVILTTLFSCSNDDNNTNPDKVLQKVVFYKNSSNEKHWIITNNLLTTITNADGSLAEEFVYDAQSRVISDVKYSNGAVTETTTITYNIDNTIQSIDNLPYTFNAATRTYTYSYSGTFTINCQVNTDFLAENFVRTGTNAGEYRMTYLNGDMTSFEKLTSSSTDVLKNFHFDAGFGSNPMYSAILAVAKVKSLTDPSFFIDCQVSKNMANGFDKGSTDPYYYNYGIVSSPRFLSIGTEVLDSSNNFVGFYSFADYYYQ